MKANPARPRPLIMIRGMVIVIVTILALGALLLSVASYRRALIVPLGDDPGISWICVDRAQLSVVRTRRITMGENAATTIQQEALLSEDGKQVRVTAGGFGGDGQGCFRGSWIMEDGTRYIGGTLRVARIPDDLLSSRSLRGRPVSTVSKALFPGFGYGEFEIQGMTVFDWLPPQDIVDVLPTPMAVNREFVHCWARRKERETVTSAHQVHLVIVSTWLLSILLGLFPLFAGGRKLLAVRRMRREGRCAHCGYLLTGNVTGRCPECGSQSEHDDDSRTPGVCENELQ